MSIGKNVLVVGTDEASADALLSVLSSQECSARFLQADRLSSCLDYLPDIVFMMIDGVSDVAERLLLNILQKLPSVPVVALSPEANRQQAVSLISAGASDYLVGTLDPEILATKIRELCHSTGDDGFIARSPKTRHVVQLAKRAAVTDASILIGGESGSGKEVLARFIHTRSHRSSGPFIAVNCAAIPESMLESVLFGHEKGAFTGAVTRHIGKFEQASGGTLFLDEVAEMPLPQQAKLLRVLQEQEVERLGGTHPVKVDVRIVSASNKDLSKCVSLGQFREDLFYRLNVFPLYLSPLRDRVEDIVPLAEFFLRRACVDTGQPEPELSQGAVSALMQYSWPGNIRELENVMQRACVLKRSWVILPEDLLLPEELLLPEKQARKEGKVVGFDCDRHLDVVEQSDASRLCIGRAVPGATEEAAGMGVPDGCAETQCRTPQSIGQGAGYDYANVAIQAGAIA